MANHNQTGNSSNLLSPSSNISPKQQQQRRKSTLSGNGFFIDYSCTRRRSSQAAYQQQLLCDMSTSSQTTARSKQLLRTYVSPVRYQQQQPRKSISHQSNNDSNPNSPSRAQSRISRTSCSAATSSTSTNVNISPTSNAKLQAAGPILQAPFALAGSRKTSIFDSSGHSIGMSKQQLLSRRRKSTMVTTNSGRGLMSRPLINAEPNNQLLSAVVSKAAEVTTSAAAASVARRYSSFYSNRTTPNFKGELANHVPVIGCSPTSIRASLAVLDETKKYEKFLKRLHRNQRKKEKRRLKEYQEFYCDSSNQSNSDNSNSDVSSGELEAQNRYKNSFRRKSIKALREAANLIKTAATPSLSSTSKVKKRLDTLDDISLSSMSFCNSSARASMPSLSSIEMQINQNFNEPANLADYGDHDRGLGGEFELNNDELFVDENNLINFERHRYQAADKRIDNVDKCDNRATMVKRPSVHQSSGGVNKSSLVRMAMRKLTSSMGNTSSGQLNGPSDDMALKSLGRQSSSLRQHNGNTDRVPASLRVRRRSISMAGNLNYWYYYYYYLRENSPEDAKLINDLPLSASASTALLSSSASNNKFLLSDLERKIQLHINYSLARLEILNSHTNPIEQLAERMAQVEAEDSRRRQEMIDARCEGGGLGSSAGNNNDDQPDNLFDFDQSTDVSLALSTTTESSICSNNSLCPSQANASGSEQFSEPMTEGGSTTSLTSTLSDNNSGYTTGSSMTPTRPLRPLRSGIGYSPSLATTRLPLCSTISSSSMIAAPLARGYRYGAGPDSALANNSSALLHCRKHSRSAQSVICERRKYSADDELTSNTQLSRNHLLPAKVKRSTGQHPSRRGTSMRIKGSATMTGRRHQRPNDAGQPDNSGAAYVETHNVNENSENVRAANEEEIDDFERFNASHRGYKPTPGESLVEGAPIKIADAPDNIKAKRKQKTIRARITNLRLSFKSVRSARNNCKKRAADDNERAGENADQCCSSPATRRAVSTSWDQLAGVPNEDGLPGRDIPLAGGQVRQRAQQQAQRQQQSSNFSAAGQPWQEACQASVAATPSSIMIKEAGFKSGRRQRQTAGRCGEQRSRRKPDECFHSETSLGRQINDRPAATDNNENQIKIEIENNNNDSSNNNLYSAEANSSEVCYGRNYHYAEPATYYAAAAEYYQPPINSTCFCDGDNNQCGAVHHYVYNYGSHSNLAGFQPTEQAQAHYAGYNEAELGPPKLTRRRRLSSSLRVSRPRQPSEDGPAQDCAICCRAENQSDPPGTEISLEAPGAGDSNRSMAASSRARAYSTGTERGGPIRQVANLARLGVRSDAELMASSEQFNDDPSPDSLAARAGNEEESMALMVDNPSGNRSILADQRVEQRQILLQHLDLGTGCDATDSGADRLRERNLNLLNKKSFNCMLLGSRRTGKRTIVKCFIKLLNEFKLAVDEYRKEKVLNKLLDCSEQLQELELKRQEQLEAIKLAAQQTTDHQSQNQDRKQSGRLQSINRLRLNSWLGNVESFNKMLSSKNVKRRIHSFVGTTTNEPATNSTVECAAARQDPSKQRRHTAIESTDFQFKVESEENDDCDNEKTYDDDRHKFRSSSGHLLGEELNLYNSASQASGCNKSDFNINYNADNQDNCEAANETLGEQEMTHKLEVPDKFDWPARRQSENNHKAPLPLVGPRRSLGNYVMPTGQAQQQPEVRHYNYRDRAPRTSQSFRKSTQLITGDDGSLIRDEFRRKSVQLKRSLKPILSLKEINKRLVRVKFKTRRQLNETKYLNQNQAPNDNWTAEMPDMFIVVYSINDRESFNFAKTLIGQLLSVKQDLPMPIILVANKIDLERAKGVPLTFSTQIHPEGRCLAKRNRCKFIEVSCTVGYNLDTLLVGIRTQLVLKHHTTLNSILRHGKTAAKLHDSPTKAKCTTNNGGSTTSQQPPANNANLIREKGNGDSILKRFYKKLVMDSGTTSGGNENELDYECDNFSKL